MPKAIYNGAVIADSEQTEVVEGNHYFPPDSVDRQYLRESQTRTECGWKGTASYYDVVVNGEASKDAAWYYPSPKPEAANIGGYVAFWKAVEVEE